MIGNEANELSGGHFLAPRCGIRVLLWLWSIGRLPLLFSLTILEPMAALLLGGLALLGLLATIFFKLIAAPHFPTGTMLAISLSFALALMLYEGAIQIISD